MVKKEGLNLANRITMARIICVPFFIASIVYARHEIALAIFVIAVISDGLDGFIARALKQQTMLGTILDPVADKLLIVSAYICLSLAMLSIRLVRWLRQQFRPGYLYAVCWLLRF